MMVGQTRQQMKLDSREWDHSCNTGNVTADGKYLEEVDAFDTDGIQGRHIAKYSKQRRLKGGNAAKLFSLGWCLETPLWYDLVDFWRARESKCLMVLSILESLKA